MLSSLLKMVCHVIVCYQGLTDNVRHVAVEGLGDASGVDASGRFKRIAVDVLHVRDGWSGKYWDGLLQHPGGWLGCKLLLQSSLGQLNSCCTQRALCLSCSRHLP